MTITDTTVTGTSEAPQEGTETPDASQTGAAAHGGQAPEPEGQESDDHREAFKQREKRREAEAARDAATAERDRLTAERDQLAGQVTALRRAEAERLALGTSFSGGLHNGADLWAAGVKLEDLLSQDDTTVDVTKVRAAVKELTASRPYLRRSGTRSRMGAGRVGAGSDEPDSSLVGTRSGSWDELIKGE